MTTSVGTVGSSTAITSARPAARRSGFSVMPGGAGGSYSAKTFVIRSPRASSPRSCTARRGRQRHRRLLGRAVADTGVAGERQQGHRQLVAVFDDVAFRNRLGANGYNAELVGAQHQPVAQFLSRPAVVVVVVLDPLEYGCGIVGLAGG